MSKAAERIKKRLPSWSKLRRDPASAGGPFLKAIGREFDKVSGLTRAVGREKHIQTANIKQPCMLYVAKLPHICLKSGVSAKFIAAGAKINIVQDLYEFLTKPGLPPKTNDLYQPEYGYIDKEKRFLYLHSQYDNYVKVAAKNSSGEVLFEGKLELSPLKIWNTFDEFGALLSLPRLPHEDNASYKRRILSVCRLPGSSNNVGLTRALARELGLLKDYTWTDGGADYTIQHYDVNVETIMVDYEPAGEWSYDSRGRVVLSGLLEYNGQQRIVTYASCLEFHDLGDNNDPFVFSLFCAEAPGEEVYQLKDIIDNQAPVKWGQFVWGDAFWDSGDNGLIPDIYDASCKGWVQWKG
jgi:hypothetical protein